MPLFDICEEAPVALHINGQKHMTFMCTPKDLKELAVGYLCTAKIIETASDIHSVAACSDMKVIYAQISKELGGDYGLGKVLASGCGSGMFTEDFLEQPDNHSTVCFSLESLVGFAKEMFQNAELYKKHGGVHISCLATPEKIVVQKEDIGRHNTVDKVIGYGVLNGIDFANTCVITSGRISTDMVVKAVNMGVPVLVSRSIPTTLALEIAEQKGITIVGRIVGTPIVYSHSQRLRERG